MPKKKNKIVLRPYQEEAVDKALWAYEKYSDNSLVVMPTGCHSYGYPILMADFSVREVQDIRVGDAVMGVDFKPRTVVKLHAGREQFYRVSVSPELFFDVNAGHILFLTCNRICKYPQFETVSIVEYLRWTKYKQKSYSLRRAINNSSSEYCKFTITKLEKDTYFGFELDNNSDRLYIDGQGFVQHNSGKSLVVSGIADRLQKEILILQPSKEILEQNVAKMQLYVPDDEIGIYSASAKRKDISKYTFATIQSVYKKPELFKHIGLCIADECHLINPKRARSMYSSFLRNVGKPSVIGLTATPFRNMVYGRRLPNGMFTSSTSLRLINRVNPRFWNRIVFNIDIAELIDAGYLSPLRYVDRSQIPHGRIPLNKSGSDYDLMYFERLLKPYETHIVNSIIKSQEHTKASLVFCSSLEQAERMSKVIPNSAFVSGDTPTKERDEIIKQFRGGIIKTVLNYSVLGIGFDFPELDCIYLLRPTKSLSLYLQFLGRGTRKAQDKEFCYLLDYSGSFKELGAIEDVKYRKEGNLWEVYANGQKMHGKVIYER